MKKIFTINIDPNRIFGLDLLRAAAIIFVVISHQGGIWPKDNWYFGVFGKLMGYDGVSIFFVLSGFLIGGILIKTLEKGIITKTIILDFWIRRWIRTIPAYLLMIFIMCVIHYFFVDEFQISNIFKYLFFLQNLFNPHPDFYPEAWSLTIEEWFYLLVPIIIYIIIKIFKISVKKSIFLTSILLIIMITTFRYHKSLNISLIDLNDWDRMFRKQVSTRLDSLVYGVLAAYINFYYNSIWQKIKNKLLITGLFMFLIFNFLFPKIFVYDSLFNTVFSFSFISIATAFLLPFLSNMKSGKSIIFTIITYISLISYSLYLLNLSIVNIWIINSIPWENFTTYSLFNLFLKNIAYWFVLITLSIIMYKYFELPIMKLRDKIKLKKTLID